MIGNRTPTTLSTTPATSSNPFSYCYSRIEVWSQTAEFHSILDRRKNMQESRKPTSSHIGWTIVALATLAVLIPQAASAWWWIQPEYEVKLKVVGSSVFPFRSDDPADFWMVSTSGWPLTMFLRADHEYLGIGTPYGYPYYPTMDTPLPFPLVFGDENSPYGPDECPSWNDPLGIIVEGCLNLPLPWPVDETILPFIPGLTVPDGCCSDRPNCCAEIVCPVEAPPCNCTDAPVLCETPPSQVLTTQQDAGGTFRDWYEYVGPRLGSDTDEYTYGSNPRLEGLVITADVGPGIETDENFNRTGRCRNLAGFAQSISYVLSDRFYNTSVVAQMNVPAGLFSPVVVADNEVTDDCDGDPTNFTDSLLRIDGLPWDDPTDFDGDTPLYTTYCSGTSHAFMISLTRDMLVTARVFVVQVDEDGEGPDFLEDLNGDGSCDAADAEAQGWRLLSKEEIIRFTQAHEEEVPFQFDFDGNGNPGNPVLPGGTGGLTRPPR